MKITGTIEEGKIVIPKEVFMQFNLQEGEEITFEYKLKTKAKEKAKKDLFGALKGTVEIHGDIISPVNEKWEASS